MAMLTVPGVRGRGSEFQATYAWGVKRHPILASRDITAQHAGQLLVLPRDHVHAGRRDVPQSSPLELCHITSWLLGTGVAFTHRSSTAVAPSRIRSFSICS